ncbi:hypothetical protein [Komarekiella delphini-convector]|nr:hypothetical protein [Komarekiella delphini-convector]
MTSKVQETGIMDSSCLFKISKHLRHQPARIGIRPTEYLQMI